MNANDPHSIPGLVIASSRPRVPLLAVQRLSAPAPARPTLRRSPRVRLALPLPLAVAVFNTDANPDAGDANRCQRQRQPEETRPNRT